MHCAIDSPMKSLKAASRSMTFLGLTLVATGCGIDSDAVIGTWGQSSPIRDQDSDKETGTLVTFLSIFGDGTFVTSSRAQIDGQSPDQGDINHGTWEFNERRVALDFSRARENVELAYDPQIQALTTVPPNFGVEGFTLQPDIHEEHLAAASSILGEWTAEDNGKLLTFVFAENSQLSVIAGNSLESYFFFSHFCSPVGMLEVIRKDKRTSQGREVYIAEFIGPDLLRIGLRRNEPQIEYISWNYVEKTLILKRRPKNDN